MTCDGSGELRWGWTCPGCERCCPDEPERWDDR